VKTPAIAAEVCADCEKTPELCLCSAIQPLKSRLHVLILQHPQEPDKELGSALLAHRSLPNSTLKIGLSWANLKKALGREEAQSSRWAVLYLGSGVKAPADGKAPKADPRELVDGRLRFVSKTGSPIPPPSEPLEGIVIIDGTWSQAKALWWRNAWLLKLKRVILMPKQRSLYKELRKEPRGECLSTIESIAECLGALGEPAATEAGLKGLFAELLNRQRARLKERRQGSQQKRFDSKPAVAIVSPGAGLAPATSAADALSTPSSEE
jgi:DTW domain-containing protein YfiP